MSIKKNVKKGLSKVFNALAAFDRKLDQTKIGGALNRGLGKLNSVFNKTAGKPFVGSSVILAGGVGMFFIAPVSGALFIAAGGIALGFDTAHVLSRKFKERKESKLKKSQSASANLA